MPMLQTWTRHFLSSAPSFLIAGLLSLGVIGLITTHFVLLSIILVAAVAVGYYCSISRVTATA
jgi:hypothetical protein